MARDLGEKHADLVMMTLSLRKRDIKSGCNEVEQAFASCKLGGGVLEGGNYYIEFKKIG